MAAMGWTELIVNAPSEFVIGYVEGSRRIQNSSEFLNARGHRKVAFAFSFKKVAPDVVEVTTETRVVCSSHLERWTFGFYWTLIRPFSGMVRTEILRLVKTHAEAEWGRSDPERCKGPPEVVVKLPRLLLYPVRAFFKVSARFAPSVAVWALGHMMVQIPRRKAKPDASRFLESGRQREFRFGNSALVGYEFGQGPSVLLVHGLLGSSCDFQSLVPMLVEAGFKAVAIDWTNHGRSPDGVVLSPESFRCLAALMEEMEDIHGVIGHSAGAYIVMMACALVRSDRGPRVAVLISAPSSIAVPIRAFMNYFRIPERLYCDVLRWFERYLDVPMSKLGLDGAYKDSKAVLSTDAVLCAHDPQDRYAPYVSILKSANATGWARFERPGAGHFGLLHDLITRERVRDFLQTVQRRDGTCEFAPAD
jgi:pimeloyl-ACP methyl ester carboxylesterase